MFLRGCLTGSKMISLNGLCSMYLNLAVMSKRIHFPPNRLFGGPFFEWEAVQTSNQLLIMKVWIFGNIIVEVILYIFSILQLLNSMLWSFEGNSVFQGPFFSCALDGLNIKWIVCLVYDQLADTCQSLNTCLSLNNFLTRLSCLPFW